MKEKYYVFYYVKLLRSQGLHFIRYLYLFAYLYCWGSKTTDETIGMSVGNKNVSFCLSFIFCSFDIFKYKRQKSKESFHTTIHGRTFTNIQTTSSRKNKLEHQMPYKQIIYNNISARDFQQRTKFVQNKKWNARKDAVARKWIAGWPLFILKSRVFNI